MLQTTNQYIIQWVYPLLIPIIQPPNHQPAWFKLNSQAENQAGWLLR